MRMQIFNDVRVRPILQSLGMKEKLLKHEVLGQFLQLISNLCNNFKILYLVEPRYNPKLPCSKRVLKL